MAVTPVNELEGRGPGPCFEPFIRQTSVSHPSGVKYTICIEAPAELEEEVAKSVKRMRVRIAVDLEALFGIDGAQAKDSAGCGCGG